MKRFNKWHDFFNIPQGHIRIALYLIHHGNGATKKQIVEALTNAGDGRNPESIERMIYFMLEKRVLKEHASGILSLKNPARYRFCIKWIRGNFLDRWVSVSIPFLILAILFLTINSTISFFFLSFVLAIIVVWLIDDKLHILEW